MESVKEKILEFVQSQPEDSTYDEILKELAFERMVTLGLEDSRKENLISNKTMEQRIKTWQQ